MTPQTPTSRQAGSPTGFTPVCPLVFALAVIAYLALVVVAIVLAIRTGSDDVNPAHKILRLTAQDIDPEAMGVRFWRCKNCHLRHPGDPG
jgi:hypothetical protein